MTRLWPKGEAVEVLRHPQYRDADAAWGVRPVETPTPDWRRPSPGWSTPASDWCMPAPGWCTPAGFVWRGISYYTLAVCNRWRVHTRWWEPDQTLWREYLKVLVTPVTSVTPATLVAPATTADRLDRSSDLGSAGNGFLCLLYCDLLLGDWFLARIYD